VDPEVNRLAQERLKQYRRSTCARASREGESGRQKDGLAVDPKRCAFRMSLQLASKQKRIHRQKPIRPCLRDREREQLFTRPLRADRGRRSDGDYVSRERGGCARGVQCSGCPGEIFPVKPESVRALDGRQALCAICIL
jgi:hypothetical protein